MLIATLLVLAPLGAVSTAAAVAELPMPPPPEGMKRLGVEEASALLDESAPEPSERIDAESAELEALRALEQETLDADPDPTAALRASLRRLGPGHPLRLRLDDLLEDDHRDVAPPELGPVKDVLRFNVAQVQDRYDIPIEMRPLVAQYVRFFQNRGRPWFRKWMSRSTRYIPVMQPILEERGVPKDTVYLAMIESGFSAQAYSWAHAAGPWQFIPATGKHYGLRQDFWVDERRDPIKATHAAAKYLKQLHAELGHWYLAWAGYNAGGGRIRRLMNRKNTDDFWEISSGRAMPEETQHYVPKLIAAALIAKNPGAFGFTHEEFDYEPPLEFDEVPVVDPTDLAVLARAARIGEDELRALNPELKRWCTPPATEKKPYVLRIPKGRAEAFTLAMSKVPKKERMRYAHYRVRPGDTLSRIASRFDTTTEVIMKFNRLKNARRLRVNAELMIPVPMRAQAAARSEPSASARRAGARHEIARAAPARASSAPKSAARLHNIVRGETLWSVSQRYGVSVAELKRWNGISDHRAVRVGQKLRVASP